MTKKNAFDGLNSRLDTVKHKSLSLKTSQLKLPKLKCKMQREKQKQNRTEHLRTVGIIQIPKGEKREQEHKKYLK